MALSVKNLTYALSEVRGVCECDTLFSAILLIFRHILGASDCLPIHLDGEIAVKASRKRGDGA